jgi:hypothetical protein
VKEEIVMNTSEQIIKATEERLTSKNLSDSEFKDIELEDLELLLKLLQRYRDVYN